MENEEKGLTDLATVPSHQQGTIIRVMPFFKTRSILVWSRL